MALLGLASIAVGLLLVRAATLDPPSVSGAVAELLGGGRRTVGRAGGPRR